MCRLLRQGRCVVIVCLLSLVWPLLLLAQPPDWTDVADIFVWVESNNPDIPDIKPCIRDLAGHEHCLFNCRDVPGCRNSGERIPSGVFSVAVYDVGHQPAHFLGECWVSNGSSCQANKGRTTISIGASDAPFLGQADIYVCAESTREDGTPWDRSSEPDPTACIGLESPDGGEPTYLCPRGRDQPSDAFEVPLHCVDRPDCSFSNRSVPPGPVRVLVQDYDVLPNLQEQFEVIGEGCCQVGQQCQIGRARVALVEPGGVAPDDLCTTEPQEEPPSIPVNHCGPFTLYSKHGDPRLLSMRTDHGGIIETLGVRDGQGLPANIHGFIASDDSGEMRVELNTINGQYDLGTYADDGSWMRLRLSSDHVPLFLSAATATGDEWITLDRDELAALLNINTNRRREPIQTKVKSQPLLFPSEREVSVTTITRCGEPVTNARVHMVIAAGSDPKVYRYRADNMQDGTYRARIPLDSDIDVGHLLEASCLTLESATSEFCDLLKAAHAVARHSTVGSALSKFTKRSLFWLSAYCSTLGRRIVPVSPEEGKPETPAKQICKNVEEVVDTFAEDTIALQVRAWIPGHGYVYGPETLVSTTQKTPSFTLDIGPDTELTAIYVTPETPLAFEPYKIEALASCARPGLKGKLHIDRSQRPDSIVDCEFQKIGTGAYCEYRVSSIESGAAGETHDILLELEGSKVHPDRNAGATSVQFTPREEPPLPACDTEFQGIDVSPLFIEGLVHAYTVSISASCVVPFKTEAIVTSFVDDSSNWVWSDSCVFVNGTDTDVCTVTIFTDPPPLSQAPIYE